MQQQNIMDLPIRKRGATPAPATTTPTPTPFTAQRTPPAPTMTDSANLLARMLWYGGGRDIGPRIRSAITEGGPPTLGMIAGGILGGPVGSAVGGGTGYLLDQGIKAGMRYLWPQQSQAAFGPPPTVGQVATGTALNVATGGAMGLGERALVSTAMNRLATQAAVRPLEPEAQLYLGSRVGVVDPTAREVALTGLERSYGSPTTLTQPMQTPPPIPPVPPRDVGTTRRAVQNLLEGPSTGAGTEPIQASAAAAAARQRTTEAAEVQPWVEHGRDAFAGRVSTTPSTTPELSAALTARRAELVSQANKEVSATFAPADQWMASQPVEKSTAYFVKGKPVRMDYKAPVSYQAPLGSKASEIDAWADEYRAWYKQSKGGLTPDVAAAEPGETIGGKLRYVLRSIIRNDERLASDPAIAKLQQLALPNPNRPGANLTINLSTMMRDRSFLRRLQYKVLQSKASHEAYPILADVVDMIDEHITSSLAGAGDEVAQAWARGVAASKQLHETFDRPLATRAARAATTKTGYQLGRGTDPLILESVADQFGPTTIADIRAAHYDAADKIAQYLSRGDPSKYGKHFRASFTTGRNIEYLDRLYEGRDWRGMLDRIDPPTPGGPTSATKLAVASKMTTAGGPAEAADRVLKLVTTSPKFASEVSAFWPEAGEQLGPYFAEKTLTLKSFKPSAWLDMSPESKLALAGGRDDVVYEIDKIIRQAQAELMPSGAAKKAAVPISSFRQFLDKIAPSTTQAVEQAARVSMRSPKAEQYHMGWVTRTSLGIINDLIRLGPKIISSLPQKTRITGYALGQAALPYSAGPRATGPSAPAPPPTRGRGGNVLDLPIRRR